MHRSPSPRRHRHDHHGYYHEGPGFSDTVSNVVEIQRHTHHTHSSQYNHRHRIRGMTQKTDCSLVNWIMEQKEIIASSDRSYETSSIDSFLRVWIHHFLFFFFKQIMQMLLSSVLVILYYFVTTIAQLKRKLLNLQKRVCRCNPC